MDECAIMDEAGGNVCQAFSVNCTNTEGSIQCACEPGFVFDRRVGCRLPPVAVLPPPQESASAGARACMLHGLVWLLGASVLASIRAARVFRPRAICERLRKGKNTGFSLLH
eukprot:2881615-Rhodomonas_salina.1